MLPVGTTVKVGAGQPFKAGPEALWIYPVYAKCGAAERAPRPAALTFPDILSDPLVRLVMKADGVDPKALELRTLGHRGLAAGADRKRCSTRTCRLLSPSLFDVASPAPRRAPDGRHRPPPPAKAVRRGKFHRKEPQP